MAEIELRIDNKSSFEYETESVPRVGDFLDITHEEANGEFKVVKVSQRIYQDSKSKKVRTYAKVEAESAFKGKLTNLQKLAIEEVHSWDRETLLMELKAIICTASDDQLTNTIFFKA